MINESCIPFFVCFGSEAIPPFIALYSSKLNLVLLKRLKMAKSNSISLKVFLKNIYIYVNLKCCFDVKTSLHGKINCNEGSIPGYQTSNFVAHYCCTVYVLLVHNDHAFES